MAGSLLLLAYPHEGEVLTQFFGATSQESAFIYTGGNPTIVSAASSSAPLSALLTANRPKSRPQSTPLTSPSSSAARTA